MPIPIQSNHMQICKHAHIDKCLKHSYYTRVGCSFSGLFYSNFIVFVTRLLIWCLVWMQVHWSEKNKLWKQIGVMESNARKWLPRRDVSTSRRFQRRDVGSTNTEVNNLKRRDASTSRRLNVATLQCRDVSSRSTPHHLKYEGLRN